MHLGAVFAKKEGCIRISNMMEAVGVAVVLADLEYLDIEDVSKFREKAFGKGSDKYALGILRAGV